MRDTDLDTVEVGTLADLSSQSAAVSGGGSVFYMKWPWAWVSSAEEEREWGLWGEGPCGPTAARGELGDLGQAPGFSEP